MKTSPVLFAVLSLVFCGVGAAFGQQSISEEARRHFDRGMAAVEMATTAADYESAIKEFKEAIRLAPDWPDACYNLGLVQEKAGKLGEAVESYKSYLRLSPGAEDAEAVKSLVNKLEYMAERENEINQVYKLMLMRTDQVRWVRISKNGDDQPDWEVEHRNDLKPKGYLDSPLFYMKDGSLFKVAYVVDTSVYPFRSLHRPMQRDLSYQALVKVNGRFFEYRYGFVMRIEYKYEDTDGGELSIKAEIISTDPPRIKRVQQVNWPDGLTSVTEFVYELDDIKARVEAEASKPTPVDRLLDAGREVMAKADNGGTLLHWAAANDHAEVAERLIAEGLDIDVRDKNGDAPLHWAAGWNKAAAATVLIAHGADVNARRGDGATPLHDAARSGALNVAGLLIAKGAGLNAKDAAGRTPLALALANGRKDVADLLKKNGAREDPETPVR